MLFVPFHVMEPMKALFVEESTSTFINVSHILGTRASQVALVVKNLPAMQETKEMHVSSLGWEDFLEEKMATHSSILAWRILWTAAPQTPLSMGFPTQEYWSGLPFSPPGDLPEPGIEPRSPALQTYSLLSEPPGKP